MHKVGHPHHPDVRTTRCAPQAPGTPADIPLAERRFRPPPSINPIGETVRSLAGERDETAHRHEREWDVIQILGSHEKVFSWSLYDFGVGYFLPLQTVRAETGGRFRTRHLPILPGYVFTCTADWQRTRTLIRQSDARRHVLQFLRVTDQQSLTRDLAKIEFALAAGKKPGENFTPGRACRVTSGAFKDWPAEVDREGKRGRMILNIPLLGQRVAFETDVALLEPA
jgi:transcription antitermination factor NusG